MAISQCCTSILPLWSTCNATGQHTQISEAVLGNFRLCWQDSLGRLSRACMGPPPSKQGAGTSKLCQVPRAFPETWCSSENWCVYVHFRYITLSKPALSMTGVYNLEPPTRVCLDPLCAQQLLSDTNILCDCELVEPLTFPITLFTKEFGAVPGYATSRYCRSMLLHFISVNYLTSHFRMQHALLSKFLCPHMHYYPNVLSRQ